MNNINFILIFLLSISIDTISNFLPGLAQISSKIQLAGDPPTRPLPPPPEGGDDSATRSEFCDNTKLSIKPLMRRTDGIFSGLTLKEHPTFWFYVPYKSDSVSQGKFVLEDEEGIQKVRYLFKLPQTPGFVSFTIPLTKEPLVTNKRYRWSFTLYCSSPTSSEPKHDLKEGWVTRVDMANLETQLKTAKLEERIKLYIDNKIWYDAASDVANSRESPGAWIKLLEAASLQDLKQEMIGGEVILIEN